MSESSTLLVIDEEAYLLRTFVQLAESAGYRVKGSPDARQGWDLAKRFRPDLILVNTIPPDGHAKHLCQQVKADPLLAHAAIVMLAGSTSVDGALDSPVQPDLPGIDVDEYIQKPITSRDLFARVQAMLRVKQSETQLVQLRKELREKQALLVTARQQLRSSPKRSRPVLPATQKQTAPAPFKRSELYETLPLACCTIDKYGLILEANNCAAQQCGTQRAQFVETLFPDYVAENDVSTFFEHLSRVFESKQRQSCQLTLKTGNGHPAVMRVESLVQPKKSQDDGEYCTMTLTDVTPYIQKGQHEQQISDPRGLAVTRCQLHAILESVNDGVTLCDITGHFDVFNTRMQELTGYSKAEANQHMDFQLALYPDPTHYHQAIVRMATIMASGEPQSAMTTIRTKAGREKSLTVYTMRVTCDQQEWLLSTYQDVTDYRNLKQKLLRSQKRRRTRTLPIT